MRYLLEGAAARGEARESKTKIDLQATEVRVALGQAPATPPPTPALLAQLPPGEREKRQLQVALVLASSRVLVGHEHA